MFSPFKKVSAAIGIILCLFSFAFAYSGGSGEPNNPYQIATVSDWNDLMSDPNDWNKHFIMTADVNLQGVTLTPVGKNQSKPFVGVFNGNGHIISNIDINSPPSTRYYVGLFGYLSSGKICNLGIEDVNITGENIIVGGGLVGANYKGSINTCYATGKVNGYGSIGGLVGGNSGGTITNCYAAGVVSGLASVGGLVGRNVDWGDISACYATGTVTGSSSVGGLVGYSYSSTITDCYATDAVAGNSYIGGLVGLNKGEITGCYAAGAVTGGSSVGGLVGWNYKEWNYIGTINNCYATGSVSGSDRIGGLVGWNYFSIITACYATGAVTGSSSVGGLVGYRHHPDSVTTSFWDIQTSGRTTSAGGTGKTTAQMKTRSTFTSAGWDFVGETANGTKDIWTICEGVNYPKFTWQNQPPIAEAGEDQTAYAWIDGIAEVELDGLGSSDPDCNELTYYWSWVIDGNTYEANGVNPTIELPVGVHTIQLVVNDGLADSVPDDVNITVIAPLKSRLNIMPSVINRDICNRHSRCHKPENILAFIRMPEGITKKDITNEPLTLYPGEIEASRQWIVSIPCGFGRHKKWLTEIFAFFDKDDVLDAIPTNGRVELKVAGELICGRYFYGSDTVIIIGPKRPWHFPKK